MIQKMRSKILQITIPLIIFFFYPFSFSVFAQTAQTQRIGNYVVTIAQDPLSPFVGEEVEVSFDFEQPPAGLGTLREALKPAEGVKGKIVIKETTVNQYVGKNAEVGDKVIYEEDTATDMSGSVGVAYTFKKEGLYSVAFVWGDNPDTESISRQVYTREPSSYFQQQELSKRIWLFVGIAFTGVIVGSVGTFIIMTTSLHSRK